jgi:hypothetical protein
MIITVEAGVSWYDTFYDASLGVNTPTGWTLYGPAAVAPTVVSDELAYGGRALKFERTDGPTGMGMDIAGSPTTFEVLMRLRVDDESELKNPHSEWGGPGGRLKTGTGLGGVGISGNNIQWEEVCNWFCQQERGEYPEWQQPTVVGSPNISRLKSKPSTTADTTSFHNIASGPSPASCFNGIIFVSGPALAGSVVKFYSYMRLRVDGTRVRGKWWFFEEPAKWMMDIRDTTNMFWPQDAGPVGALIYKESLEGDTFVDMISVSLDPDGFPAYLPDAVEITSTCPLPDAQRGVAYSYQLESTLPTA